MIACVARGRKVEILLVLTRVVAIHLIRSRVAQNALVLILSRIILSLRPLGVAAGVVQEVRWLLLLGVRVESVQGMIVLGRSLILLMGVCLLGLVAGLL